MLRAQIQPFLHPSSVDFESLSTHFCCMNNKYPWKQAIITGLAVSVSAIVVFSVADALNHHFNWGYNPVTLRGLTGLLTIVILAIGIYTGMAAIKRTNGGNLSYKHALICGIIIAITTALITAAGSFIYCTAINPGYATYMVSESRKVMQANGKSAEEINSSIANLQKQLTTGMQVTQALIGQTLSGTIISLIMAIFVSSRKK